MSRTTSSLRRRLAFRLGGAALSSPREKPGGRCCCSPWLSRMPCSLSFSGRSHSRHSCFGSAVQ